MTTRTTLSLAYYNATKQLERATAQGDSDNSHVWASVASMIARQCQDVTGEQPIEPVLLELNQD